MQMQYKSLIVMTIFALVMLVGAAWWGYSQIETNRRAEMRTSLETVLETSHEATRVGVSSTGWIRRTGRANAEGLNQLKGLTIEP